MGVHEEWEKPVWPVVNSRSGLEGTVIPAAAESQGYPPGAKHGPALNVARKNRPFGAFAS